MLPSPGLSWVIVKSCCSVWTCAIRAAPACHAHAGAWCLRCSRSGREARTQPGRLRGAWLFAVCICAFPVLCAARWSLCTQALPAIASFRPLGLDALGRFLCSPFLFPFFRAFLSRLASLDFLSRSPCHVVGLSKCVRPTVPAFCLLFGPPRFRLACFCCSVWCFACCGVALPPPPSLLVFYILSNMVRRCSLVFFVAPSAPSPSC